MLKKYFYLSIITSVVFLVAFVTVNAEVQPLLPETKVREVRGKAEIRKLQEAREIEKIEKLEKVRAVKEVEEINKLGKIKQIDKIKERQIIEKKAVIEKKQELRDIAKIKIASERAELKIKIKEMADQKKAEIVTRIDNQLGVVNTRRTTHLTEAVGKIEAVLERLITKTNVIKARGVDTNEVERSITSAQNAISSSRSAISLQMSKEYIIPVINNETLRINTGGVVKQLEMDLQIVNKSVINAKQAVQEVAQQVAKSSTGSVKINNSAVTID